jgi:hypothetical protein
MAWCSVKSTGRNLPLLYLTLLYFALRQVHLAPDGNFALKMEIISLVLDLFLIVGSLFSFVFCYPYFFFHGINTLALISVVVYRSFDFSS